MCLSKDTQDLQQLSFPTGVIIITYSCPMCIPFNGNKKGSLPFKFALS